MKKFYINDFEVIQDTALSTIKLELFQFLSSSTMIVTFVIQILQVVWGHCRRVNTVLSISSKKLL